MDAMEVDDSTYISRQGICCWGRSACGELGVVGDDENNVRLPTAFPWPSERNNIVQIACGKQHSVFLLETGLVYTCGANDKKQLGRDGSESVPGLNYQFTKLSLLLCVQFGHFAKHSEFIRFHVICNFHAGMMAVMFICKRISTKFTRES